MDDAHRLDRLLVVRRAKLAIAERQLRDLAALVAHSRRVADEAAAAAAAIRQHGLERIRRERAAIFSGPFHTEALAELKTTAAIVERQVATAEDAKGQALDALTTAEKARSDMAQIVLSGRTKADRLDNELLRMKKADASRREARVIEELGERKSLER